MVIITQFKPLTHDDVTHAQVLDGFLQKLLGQCALVQSEDLGNTDISASFGVVSPWVSPIGQPDLVGQGFGYCFTFTGHVILFGEWVIRA